MNSAVRIHTGPPKLLATASLQSARNFGGSLPVTKCSQKYHVLFTSDSSDSVLTLWISSEIHYIRTVSTDILHQKDGISCDSVLTVSYKPWRGIFCCESTSRIWPKRSAHNILAACPFLSLHILCSWVRLPCFLIPMYPNKGAAICLLRFSLLLLACYGFDLNVNSFRRRMAVQAGYGSVWMVWNYWNTEQQNYGGCLDVGVIAEMRTL